TTAQRQLSDDGGTRVRSLPADRACGDGRRAGSSMKYHVTLRSRTYVTDIHGGAVTVDGERLEAHWAAIAGTPLIHLLLGKDSWTIACQQHEGRARRRPPPRGPAAGRGGRGRRLPGAPAAAAAPG